jgi:hypothetical protein
VKSIGQQSSCNPYADDLRRKVDGAHRVGFLFQTWGYRNGMDEADSYGAMQARLDQGFEDLGDRLGMQVVPVGDAWYAAHVERPGLNLWAEDGRHPNQAGSYLAACVFYSQLTGRDPSRSAFTAGLDPSDARFLQQIASWVVFR